MEADNPSGSHPYPGPNKPQPDVQRKSYVRQGLVFNAAVIVLASVSIGLGISPEDGVEGVIGNVIIGFVMAIILRLPGAFIERYLARRRKRNAIVFPHLIAAINAIFVLFGEIQGPTTSTIDVSNKSAALSTIVGVYLFTSLIGLSLSAGIILLRSLWNSYRERSGRVPPDVIPINQRQQRLALMLNIVLIVFTSAMIAPGFAEFERGSLAYGFFGGLFVSVMLRTPGAFLEQYLLNRQRSRSIYITHATTGILIVLIYLLGYHPGSSENGSSKTGLFSTDVAGSTVTTYLLLSSLFLGFVTIFVSIKRQWLSHRRHRKPSETVSAIPVTRRRAPLSLENPPVFEAEKYPKLPPTLSHPTPFPVPEPRQPLPANYEATKQSRSKARSPVTVRSSRKEIVTVIGIISSITSIVGAENVYKTVIGLILGVICAIAIYALSSTHAPESPENAGVAAKDAYDHGKFLKAFDLSIVAVDRLHHFYVFEQFRGRQPSPGDTWIVNGLTAALGAARVQDSEADVHERVCTATHRLHTIASAIERAGGNAALYREALDRLAEYAPDVEISDFESP